MAEEQPGSSNVRWENARAVRFVGALKEFGEPAIPSGCLILAVDSPSDEALKVGDRIVEFEGWQINDYRVLDLLVKRDTMPGQLVSLSVIRASGLQVRVRIQIGVEEAQH